MIDKSSRSLQGCSYCILVPRFHTALISTAFRHGILGRLLYEASSAPESADATKTTCDHRVDDASERGCDSTYQGHDIETRREMLLLQCHSVGVMWKGMIPLLFPTMMELGPGANNSYPQITESAHDDVLRFATPTQNGHRDSYVITHRKKESRSKPPRRALLTLVNHFHNFILRVPYAVSSFIDAVGALDDFFCYTIHKPSACNSITLLLVPPNTPLHHQQCRSTYYSRISSTAPINPFAQRLILNENNFIRLASLSAYISTLGGGFFLCRYLSTAIVFARRQCAIALLRGDLMMALKCRINEGYCYIHGGKLNKGKKKIRLVLRDAMQMEQEGSVKKDQLLLQHPPDGELSELVVITNMCHSALRFANLIKAASESDLDNNTSFGGTPFQTVVNEQHLSPTEELQHKKRVSLTHDDFQRIRIVKDRKWRR